MNKIVNIYLLRGLTRESGHWGSFVQLLQEHIPNARIHFLDLPGAGKFVNQKASLSISGMVDFMRREYIEKLHARKETNLICAASLGGMAACEWVIRYKKDFQGMIMINSSFRKICSSRERVQPSARWNMFKVLLTQNIRKRETLIVKINSNREDLNDATINDWVEIQVKRTMTRMNIFRQTIAGMMYGVEEQKPEIPLLIVGSVKDRIVCPGCIEKIHAAFGGKLVWHPTAGHGISIDDPQWLSQEIAKWYSEMFTSDNEIGPHVSSIETC